MKLSEVKIGFHKPNTYLLTGHTGTRKTSSYGRFPGPMYIFDFDNRVDPLVRHYPDRTDIDFDTYGSDNMLAFKDKLISIVNSPGPYKTVVFDSITFLARNGVTHMISSRQREGKVLGGWRVSDIEDYSGETAIIVQFLDAVKLINRKGVNVIATAHLLPSDPGAPARLCTGAKALGPMIPGAFNEVYYYFTSASMEAGAEGSFRVQTVSTEQYSARTTYEGLPSILNITNSDLWSVLNKYLDKSSSPDSSSLAVK